ncbi:acylphosphatase [soil metagenome]
MASSVKIRVFGVVQGVNYRTSTKAKAQELGLCGTVRNEPDGSVYIEAEGTAAQIEELTEWCKQGPALAKVERVDVEEGEVKNLKWFEVVRF